MWLELQADLSRCSNLRLKRKWSQFLSVIPAFFRVSRQQNLLRGRDLIFTDLYPMPGHGLDEQRPPMQIFYRPANGARPENVEDPCRSVYAKYSLRALQIH
jgi:hypothetical protein